MQALTSKLQANTLNARQTAVNILLISNAFVWYYCIIILLQTIVPQVDLNTSTLIWLLHFGGIGFSALVGALLFNKIKNRSRFIVVWMTAGFLLSIFSVFMDLTSVPNILLLSLLFGVTLGFGMPSCMGYFSETMGIEKRGSIAGIIFFLSSIIIAIISIVSEGNVSLQTIILSVWRLFGVLAFMLFLVSSPKYKEKIVVEKTGNYGSILTQRSFLFYLVPWTMFSLIAYLSLPVQTTIINYMQTENMSTIPDVETLRGIENILLAVSAVVCGFLSDRLGRKRIAIVGFAMLGLGYSFVGLQPYSELSWYAYTFFDGFALGILYVIFVITIWADLSNGSRSEKFYAVGVLPFFISFMLRLITDNQISETVTGNSIFPFIAVFLFLAVLPLVYAPETLPDKVMKDRDLKSYVENAKKTAQKDTEKSTQKPNPKI